MQLHKLISQHCADAFNSKDPVEVTIATNTKFGHYQCNSALKLAKQHKVNPKELANNACKHLKSLNLFADVSVAGPGFINLTLDNEFIAANLKQQFNDSKCGVAITSNKKVVIDFSSPNIAKEMHVGHLRSTIIGDCLARILEFLGYETLRLNHLGDWGTQFGMLITYLTEQQHNENNLELSELVKIYQQAKQRFDVDPEFKKRSQQAVVKLQANEPSSIAVWQQICKISKRSYDHIYKILDIKLIDRGESFYNSRLKDLINFLEQKNLITTSDGAKCIYPPGFKNRDDKPLPLILQKQDGGYNYATTDLAALQQRIEDEQANWIIYITDSGQSQHFAMLFKAAALAEIYDPNTVRLDHVPFGLVQRSDGKKFKTREGNTEKLIDLLNNAINTAKELLQTRNPELYTQEMATNLGINAIKYADLSNNRTSNYIFDINKMLQFEGNTAAFLNYAYVRICSIEAKFDKNTLQQALLQPIIFEQDIEIELALHLLRFADTIENTINTLLPNRLTEYLFNLAEKFHSFFHNCRVTGSEYQSSRIQILLATKNVLACGFNLLGLKVLPKM